VRLRLCLIDGASGMARLGWQPSPQAPQA